MSSAGTRQRLAIRRARVADAGVLCAAERETARIPGRLVSRPEELDEGAFARKIEQLQRDGYYVVAERDGVIAGHALLEPLAPLAALAHVLTLTIVVHPGYTRQGIGAALMAALMYWASTTGTTTKIELRVRQGNDAAIALYEKFGFAEEGRFRRRIRLPDGSELDDICMARFLGAAGRAS